MKKNLFICLLIGWAGIAISVADGKPLTAPAHSTTANYDHILAPWRSYLEERPDTAVRSSYWSSTDLTRYAEPDFARRWLYLSADILTYFVPTVEKVEMTNESLAVVTTLFRAADSTPGHPQTLARLATLLRFEDDRWVLGSMLPHRTADWKQTRVGQIVYHYPPKHSFSKKKAGQAARLYDSIRSEMGLPTGDTLHYYVCSSPEQMAQVLGVEYYPNLPAGLAYENNYTLLTATGDEFHAHEIIHHCLAEFRNANVLALEGAAVYFGGSLGASLYDLRQMVEAEYSDELPSLQEAVSNGIEHSLLLYTYSGTLFEHLLHQKGIKASLRFLEIADVNEGIDYWCTAMEISPKEVDDYLRNAIMSNKKLSGR